MLSHTSCNRTVAPSLRQVRLTGLFYIVVRALEGSVEHLTMTTGSILKQVELTDLLHYQSSLST